VRTSFQWKGGLEIDGPRTVTINPTADFQIIGISSGGYFPRLAGATLINKGPNGSLVDPMEMAGGALLRNEGTFVLGGQAKIHLVGAGGSILNVGTLTTDPTFSAPWTIEPPIDNRGTFDLKPFTSNNPNNPFVLNSVDNSGTVIVEPNRIHIDTRTIGGEISVGTLIEHSGSILTVQVSRDEPKYGGYIYWGGLHVTGTAQLAGALNFDYVVQNVLSAAKALAGDSYRPLDMAARVGDFSSFGDLDPGDGIGYSRSFDATGLVVVAISDSQALRASSIPSSQIPTQGDLSPFGLARITDIAIADWTAAAAAGADPDQLKHTKIGIADLSGGLLGITTGDSILIDRDAAGWGWFVDATPSADDEFALGRATDGSSAHNHVDLLTTVLHELGHILGLMHSDDASDVMADSLDPRKRKLLIADRSQ